MPGKVKKSRMEAVLAATIAVPLQDNRAHIVVQHFLWRPAKRQKGVLMCLDQGLDPLVGDKLHIGGPAPPQGRDKHREPIAAAPNDRPVDLHLFTPPGLETDDRAAVSFGLSEATTAFSIV